MLNVFGFFLRLKFLLFLNLLLGIIYRALSLLLILDLALGIGLKVLSKVFTIFTEVWRGNIDSNPWPFVLVLSVRYFLTFLLLLLALIGLVVWRLVLYTITISTLMAFWLQLALFFLLFFRPARGF